MLLALSAGCTREVRQQLDIGVHHVSIVAGPDWRHVDQGRRHQLRRGEILLVLEDLGPVGREGIRREVERARDLCRRGREGEARTLMGQVPVPAEHFPSLDERQAFWRSWHEVSGAPAGLDAAAMADRFDRLLDAITALRDRTAEEEVDGALRAMGEDQRRSVASQVVLRQEGREAVIVETWNRLSHEDRRRFALVRDAGYLLVLRTERGPWLASRAAFDRVQGSLRVVRPPA